MSPHTTSLAERAQQVSQANANQALEGLYPDVADLAIQARYIAGSATLADLLAHAQKFVADMRPRSE